MDNLEKVITSMTKKDADSFVSFLQEQKLARKDLMLFRLLSADIDIPPERIIKAIYGRSNSNAYHSLRKRLLNQLTSFFLRQSVSGEPDDLNLALSALRIGRQMLIKNIPTVAAYYLKRAEVLAIRNQQPDVLDRIYNFQISHSEELNISVEEVAEKWQQNTIQLQKHQKLNIAYAIIRKQLAAARSEGTTLDPEVVINSVFNDFAISAEEANNAAFMHRVVSMARSAIISTKDYYRFEPFLLRIYSGLRRVNAFGKKDAEFELGFIFMIVHVFYRNRKFDEMRNWLEKMCAVMPMRDFRHSEYYTKYIALSAALSGFTGHNEDAIGLVKSTLQDRSLRIPLTEKLNFQLNLSVFYFQSGEFKKSNKTLIDIAHSDKWLESKMGKEWRFKKNLIEVIVQCELGNYEIALRQLNSIQKYYSQFFKHPIYVRAQLFIGFIRKLILNPEIATAADFASEVENAGMAWPSEKEDIQAITFFCWLKSKMTGRRYYDVLVESINERQ